MRRPCRGFLLVTTFGAFAGLRRVMPGDRFLHDLPKIALHCHLEGCLRAESFVELAQRHGVATNYRPEGSSLRAASQLAGEDPASVYRFTDFREFLLTFAAVSRSLADPEDYARLAREFVHDALAQNVAYGELFISPSVWQFFHPTLDVRRAVAAIRRELDLARAHDVEFALIVDLTRNFGPRRAMETARLAVELTAYGVIGVGLGGDEAAFPPEFFAEAFAYARAEGLHLVAHAGEAAGAQSVRGALDVLKVERIGHGIRALEDPALVARLVAEGMTLEICPTSNHLTGVVSPEQPHPLLELDAAGVRLCIDADDPALFRTSIAAEYEGVARLVGRPTLLRFIEQAIDASFASAARKARLRARLRSAAPEPGAGRRI